MRRFKAGCPTVSDCPWSSNHWRDGLTRRESRGGVCNQPHLTQQALIILQPQGECVPYCFERVERSQQQPVPDVDEHRQGHCCGPVRAGCMIVPRPCSRHIKLRPVQGLSVLPSLLLLAEQPSLVCLDLPFVRRLNSPVSWSSPRLLRVTAR